MEYRNLGRAGVKVSVIGVGCNQFGGVVDQDLASFLKENRMAGLMLARPCDRSRR